MAFPPSLNMRIRSHRAPGVLPLFVFVLTVLTIQPGFGAGNPINLIFDPVTKSDGLKKLTGMSKSKALGLVQGYLKRQSKDSEARRMLMHELADGGAAAQQLLVGVAQGKNESLAMEAYQILLQRGQAKLLADDMLSRLARAKPVSLALVAADQLVELKDKRSRPIFRKLVRDRKQDMVVRVASVRSLGKFGGDGIVRFLTTTYQEVQQQRGSQTLSLRKALLKALAAQGGADAVPILIDALRVSDLWDISVSTLVEIGPSALPNLRLVLETGDREVEPGVLAVLFQLRGIDAKRFLHMLEATDKETRKRAGWILLAFPDERLIPDLVSLWGSPSGYPTRAELLGITVPYYADERVKKLYERGFASEEESVVVQTLTVVSGMGDRSFDKEVLALAEDDTRAAVRVRAIEAMVELGLVEGRDLLERMLQFEEFEVRLVAAWALRWIGAPDKTAPALWDAKDGRHPKLKPLLVHAGARLAGSLVLKNSDPSHYGMVAPFDLEVASDEADVERSEVRYDGETLEIIELGSGDDVAVVFSPLVESDPTPIFAGLQELAEDRKVILFRKKQKVGIAPHQVNRVMGEWLVGAANAILKHRKARGAVDVVGWSMGAAWATMFCEADPSRCRTLQLVSPMSLDTVFWNQTVPRLVKKMTPEPLRQDVVFLESVRNRFAPRAWGLYYEQMLGRVQVSDSVKSVPLTQIHFPFLFQVPEATFLIPQKVLGSLLREKISVSLIFGEEDLFGAEWRTVAHKLNQRKGKGLSLHLVRGAGQLPLYENPEEAGGFLVEGLSD